MSKFDAILKRIEEQMPAAPQQTQQAAAGAQANTAVQAPAVDPKVVQELIAAKNEQQVMMALQKLQAPATQQKAPVTNQPAANQQQNVQQAAQPAV